MCPVRCVTYVSGRSHLCVGSLTSTGRVISSVRPSTRLIYCFQCFAPWAKEVTSAP
jgi:hypothetical protein